ncbi:hypothetical protein [Paraburkholderia sp. J8-2]|uniref:hypothetical protein n=1 Tax=Paraburkholderia sp. J8-2 TaxID=2805440 RepID=UPI002AB6E9C7|nr:hypothetical protein [Paraburkholderia sp. J8-2]
MVLAIESVTGCRTFERGAHRVRVLMKMVSLFAAVVGSAIVSVVIGIVVQNALAARVRPKGPLGQRRWRDEWQMIYTTVVGLAVGGVFVHLIWVGARIAIPGIATKLAPFYFLESLAWKPEGIVLGIVLVGGYVLFPPRGSVGNGSGPNHEVDPAEAARRADMYAGLAAARRAERAPQMREALEGRFPEHHVRLRADGVWELMRRGSDQVDMEFTWRVGLMHLDLL